MKLIQRACVLTAALVTLGAGAALPSATQTKAAQPKACAAGETAVAVAQRRQTPGATYLRLVDAADGTRGMDILIKLPAGPEFDAYQPGSVLCQRSFSPD